MTTTHARVVLAFILAGSFLHLAKPCAVVAQPTSPAAKVYRGSIGNSHIEMLVVYFDFPHVIAAFDRTFIPYSVVNEYLKPNGPAARFLNSGSQKGS